MKTRKILVSALLSGVILTSLISCGDDDNGGTSLPPIGGYDSSNDVAAADRVAYWSFDGSGNEMMSNTASNDSEGVTFSATDAVKGQAANFNAGYLAYPEIASLSTSMTSFTVSTWIKVSNNSDAPAGGAPSIFLSLARPNELFGNINFMSETGWQPSTSDTLTVKGYFISNNALAGQDTRNAATVSPEDAALGHIANANKVAGQWAQAVINWNGSTRMFTVWVNGQKVSNPAWELRGAADSPALAFTTPTHPIIGALLTYVDGSSSDVWNRPLTGKLDEMRIWKKSLSQAEINSLYQLELAGR